MPRQKSRHVDSPEAVGRRLREARERARISQRRLSFPGCSPAYISRIEAGERIPSLQLLRELGRRLGVTEDYLATGADRGGGRAVLLVDAEIALALGELDEAQVLFEQALADAGGEPEQLESLEGLGHVALKAGRHAEAADLLERALGLAGGEPGQRPALAAGLARAYLALGELTAAATLVGGCLEGVDEHGDPIAFIRLACLLGQGLTDAGDVGAAAGIAVRADAAARSFAAPATRARRYRDLSRRLAEQGEHEAAGRYARRALATLAGAEETAALADAHRLLARLRLDAGRAGEALDLLQEVHTLAAATATPFELARDGADEARALIATGAPDRAAPLLADLELRLAGVRPLEAGRACVLAADVHRDLGDGAKARELYERGIALLESVGPTRYLVDAHKRLAQTLEAEGRAVEALATLKRALEAQERAGRPHS